MCPQGSPHERVNIFIMFTASYRPNLCEDHVKRVDFIKNIGTLECTLKETFDVVIILNFGHFLVL